MKKSRLRQIIREELDKILVPRRSPEERAKKDRRPKWEKYDVEEYFLEHTPESASYKDVSHVINVYEEDELTELFKRHFPQQKDITKQQYEEFWDEYVQNKQKQGSRFFSANEYTQWGYINWIEIFDSEAGHKYSEMLA